MKTKHRCSNELATLKILKAMTSALTIEEIYSLFTECPTPSNFADFGIFGSEECIPPVGATKPEGVADLAPFQIHKNNENKHSQIKAESKAQPQQRRIQQNNRKGWVKAKPVFAPVEIAQGYQDKQLATWGKNKQEAPAQAVNQVEFSSLTAAWTTDSNSTSNKAKPKAQATTATWGKPISKTKPSSFADLMEKESSNSTTSSVEKSKNQDSNIAWNKGKQQKKEKTGYNDKEWPSLSSLSSKK